MKEENARTQTGKRKNRLKQTQRKKKNNTDLLTTFFFLYLGVDEEEEDEDMLILPDDYLSPIFISSEANANFYMVHPAHRYAGIYQALAGGMQFQVLSPI